MERSGNRYLSPRAVMDVVGVGRNTVYSLFNQRGFPAVRVGKKLLVREDDLHVWLLEQSGHPSTPTNRDTGRTA